MHVRGAAEKKFIAAELGLYRYELDNCCCNTCCTEMVAIVQHWSFLDVTFKYQGSGQEGAEATPKYFRGKLVTYYRYQRVLLSVKGVAYILLCTHKPHLHHQINEVV